MADKSNALRLALGNAHLNFSHRHDFMFVNLPPLGTKSRRRDLEARLKRAGESFMTSITGVQRQLQDVVLTVSQKIGGTLKP